jgi:hypothetical protein
VEFKLLAFLNVALFVFSILPELDGSEDSLSMLLGAHLCQFGPTESLRELHVTLDNRMWPHPIEVAMLIVPVWSAVLSARLLLVLRRAARRARVRVRSHDDASVFLAKADPQAPQPVSASPTARRRSGSRTGCACSGAGGDEGLGRGVHPAVLPRRCR